MIKAVFFDIGNTLFFYDYDFLSRLLQERFAIDRDPRELEAVHFSLFETFGQQIAKGREHREAVFDVYRQWFTDLDIDEERIAEIMDAVGSHPFPHLFWARLGDGVRETLEWFRGRGFKLGIISNAEGQIRALLKHVGIYDYFETVIDSHEVGMCKPDVRIFQRACSDLGVLPQDAVYVGDLLEVDIIGSQRAGLTPVLVDRDNRHTHAECLRIKKIKEITELALFKG